MTRCVAAWLLAVLVCGAATTAHAAPAADDGTITVSPWVKELTIAPGRSTQVTLVIQNQTRRGARIDLAPRDAARRSPAAVDVEPATAGSTARGAGRWLALDTTSVRIRPMTEAHVPVTISVPPGAKPGGYYAAVVVTQHPESNVGQIDIASTNQSTFLIVVPGTIHRDLRVRLTTPGRIRWHAGDQTWQIRLENRGDVHENISGHLTIDGAISGTTRVALAPRILLPGDTVTQRLRVPLRQAPDRYDADASVQLDGGMRHDTRAQRTWIVPWWLLLLVAAAVGTAMVRRQFSRR